MDFTFVLTKYEEVSFKEQISRALEKRTELISRKEYPHIWKYTDKFNSRKRAPEDVLKKRQLRYRVYGVFLLLLGFFMIIPSLVKPAQMPVPLLVGAFAIFAGIIYFRYGGKSGRNRPSSFDKAAIKLLRKYVKLPAGKVTVTFTDEKIQLGGNNAINYEAIERILITEDYFVLIWNGNITVFQKKDLVSHNTEEFINFLRIKSNNLFEVVTIT